MDSSKILVFIGVPLVGRSSFRVSISEEAKDESEISEED